MTFMSTHLRFGRVSATIGVRGGHSEFGLCSQAEHYGWIVEIDPFDPGSKPRKHTWLGRIKHENAAINVSDAGKVVVYTGHDEEDRPIYKFVSSGTYNPDDRKANFDLLSDGMLYVADFASGRWVPLDYENNSIFIIPTTITRSPPEYAYSASARGSAALGAGPKCYSPNRYVADLCIRIAILFEAIRILLPLTFMAICSPEVLQGLSCCRAKPPPVAMIDKYFAPIICHCDTVVAWRL